MNKKKLKISIIISLVILMLGLTYTSFAFWDQLTKSDDITVNIGEGKKIDVSFVMAPEEGKTLIPVGAVLGPDDVSEVNVKIKVVLDNEVVNPLKLEVTKTQVLIDGVTTHAGLINVIISKDKEFIQLKNDDVIVDVVITLTEPSIGPPSGYPDADAAIAAYEAIKNKEVKITLTFTASVTP